MNKHLKEAISLKKRLNAMLSMDGTAWPAMNMAISHAVHGKRRLAMAYATSGAGHAVAETKGKDQGTAIIYGAAFVQNIEKAVRRGGAKVSKALITSEYTDAKRGTIAVSFMTDAWFNATEVAEKFKKRGWRLLGIAGDKKPHRRTGSKGCFQLPENLVVGTRPKKGNNGGTWMHPKLAIPFARWLNEDFSLWCDDQIEMILTGTHPHHQRIDARKNESATYKAMQEVVKVIRDAAQKETKRHHYSNEANLVGWIFMGRFDGIDRDGLSAIDLKKVEAIERKNLGLLAVQMPYEERKATLRKAFPLPVTGKLEAA